MIFSSDNYNRAFNALPVGTIQGNRIHLEPLILNPEISSILYAMSCVDGDLYFQMPCGPFQNPDMYNEFLKESVDSSDRCLYVIRMNASNQIIGCIGYSESRPEHFRIEIGPIWIGMEHQGKGYSIDSTYLLLDHAFKNNYLRVEWRCHHLNIGSQRAALSIGFSFEGIFRKHMIIRGLSRDTMCYAIIDDNWPLIKEKLNAKLKIRNE